MATDGALCASEGVPVLTVSHVVSQECLAKHNVGALPYVVRQINAFLDTVSGSDGIVRACSRGVSVHMLTYIASRDTTSNWEDAAVSAAAGGHVHVLKWLSLNYAGHCEWGPNVMDAAARYGHLQTVQWLHKNREEGCTTDAMDWAICRGDLVMAEWLHANRTEGCTDFAMNYAAFGGHLKVLQWLSENRSEGRPGLALQAAAKHGHLPVVKWLYTRCDVRYRRLALEDAKKFGHSDVVAWLQQEQGKNRGLQELLADGMKWMWHSLQAPDAGAVKIADMKAEHNTFFSK